MIDRNECLNTWFHQGGQGARGRASWVWAVCSGVMCQGGTGTRRCVVIVLGSELQK